MSRRLLQHALASCKEICSNEQKRHIGQLALRNTPLRSGSGGRQSVSGVVATVFGSTGFLGRYVVSSIGEAGGRAVCPHRCDDLDMQHLRPMGDLGNIVTLEDFSIRNEEQIRNSISKSNVVINLIGQYTETWNFGFKEVHEDWPQKLAELCAQTPSVERLIHVTPLATATDSPSQRLAAFARGEAGLRKAFPDATVLRLAPLIGVEDRFYNDMALWIYSGYGAPVVDGGYGKVQPLFVLDAAEAIYKTLQFSDAKGSTYELGGPDVMTMKECAYTLCDEMRENRKLFHVPTFFAGPAAQVRTALAQHIPLHMMTRDLVFTPSNLAESSLDRVVSEGAKSFEELELKPRSAISGVGIDHIRHWRKGGYDSGTNEPVSA